MIFNKVVARKIAHELLEKKAVILRPEKPFTWASGWKSPIYCDNRILLSYPESREIIKYYFHQLIKDKFPEVNHIVAVATAGIAHGALIADMLKMPFSYARTKAKEHGRNNAIEGNILPSDRILVVEDLVSTGKSSFGVVDALVQQGFQVMGLISIFSYEFDIASNEVQKRNIPFYSLSNYPVLIEEAMNMKYIQASDMELLNEWRKNPSGWQR